MFEIKENEMKAETAMIVGIQHYKNDVAEIEDHLDELEQLVNNIEIDVVNKNIVKLRKITAKYYIGKGKAEELRDTCKRLQIEILVFDEVLSPSQQKNLDKLIGITVIDRQEVILDIFSKRARTKEAKLQIELARAEYNLPRLKRMWTHLSRQKGGGVTQRGTGEKQIEVDRRLVGDRITRLKEELEQVKKHRNVQRKKRQEIPLPNAAIVGYT
ncbi:MAG: GTPase HflX, partial [Verrucomicrobiota bacterium]|nr:GTPase HflX [Verrucomicrobiota bacterium]